MSRIVAVVGATGRMGRLISGIVQTDPAFQLGPALHRGDDLTALAEADLVVDVTAPQHSPTVVTAAMTAGRPILVGTSGWSEERLRTLRTGRTDRSPAVLVVPNFALGAVLAGMFAEQAARWFDSVEIVEAHHPGKTDSPSGTAVATAERIAAARGELGPVVAPHTDQRARGQQVGSIPVHSVRLAGLLARQEVLFGGRGEVLTIRHETSSPDAYTAGIRLALAALPALTGVTVGLESLLLAPRAVSTTGPAAEPATGPAGSVD